MAPPHRQDRRARQRARPPERGGLFVVGVTAFAMVLGVCMLHDGIDAADGPPQPPAAAAADRLPTGAPRHESRQLPPATAPLPASAPVRIRIPAIRVDAPLVDVGLDAEGWIAPPPPEQTNLAGWFRDSVAPGTRGTSVIVGHVDNQAGPVVFYNLGALKKGHTVQIVRRDGRVAEFVVYGIEVFDKNDFPGERVYSDTGHPEVRVITCGGGYSKASGYLGNVVVFARMTGTV
ncbi:hypothetical protein GCM10027168_06810 [Streptomyces capparidis]